MNGDTLFSILLVGLVLCAGLGVFWIMQVLPLAEQQAAQVAFVQNLSHGLPPQAGQFYPNMRFASADITYSFGSACSEDKRAGIVEAFHLLEAETPLRFTSQGIPVLFVACEDQEVPTGDEGHFIAGEGGPTKTINASTFFIIQAANISLYRDERCETPHVSLHEILHALGFDHTSNSLSIMYPVTNCKQTLDVSITDELTRLYMIPSQGDLVLSDVNLTIANGYLAFVVTIANQGLADITNASLLMTAGNVHTFDLGALEVGKIVTLSVENVRVPKVTEVSFRVSTDEPELSLTNNGATLATSEPLNSRSS